MKGIWSNTLPNNINFLFYKEVVCDYHRKEISSKNGVEIIQGSSKEY